MLIPLKAQKGMSTDSPANPVVAGQYQPFQASLFGVLLRLRYPCKQPLHTHAASPVNGT